MQLLITQKAYKVLDGEFKDYIREILNDNYKLMCYDIGNNRQNSNNPYVNGNVIINKEQSLIGRKSYEGLIMENNINMSEVIKRDPEFIYMKAIDSMAFVRYYKLSFMAYKKKSYFIAMRNLELAIKLRGNDHLVDVLMKRLKAEMLSNNYFK
jgi:hypothetical protein